MRPRKLSLLDQPNIIKHLTSLQGHDRRLRFGCMVSDDYIVDYVNKSFVSDSKWFGVVDTDNIVAACHVAFIDKQAELGCSVNIEYRGTGLAQSMFDRAMNWVRIRGVTEVYMHCLSENGAMKHIARKNDMLVVSECGDSDASVHVKPATPFVHFEDAYADRLSMYDMLYRYNMDVWNLNTRYDKSTNLQ